MAASSQCPAGLSLAECRRLLGQDAEQLTDDELERLRDDLYDLAGIVVTMMDRVVDSETEEAVLASLPPDVGDAVTERAAVLEFDAKMTRGSAIRTAVAAQLRPQAPREPEES